VNRTCNTGTYIMKNNDNDAKVVRCAFSDQNPLCRTLQEAGVPADEKWWSLVLYLRSLKHHHYLSDKQKAEIQEELVKLLRAKNFSAEIFRALVERQEAILSSPYKVKLRQALDDSVALLKEFGKLLRDRRDNVQHLEQVTVDTIQSGLEPGEAVAKLRGAFKVLAESLEEDANNLKVLAMTDPLTGLANRRGFDAFMKTALGGGLGGPGRLCMLMADIDYFKRVNDTYGHRIGDQALAMVAGHLLEVMRERFADGFHAARYGGEEFVVVLPNVELAEALEAAEAVRRDIENYNFVIRNATGAIIERDVTITVSIGVAGADAPFDGWSQDSLVERADAALYAAKSQGRNRVLEHRP